MLLSARETADLLGIKLDTLYAYVSRGLLSSIEIADSRERHYDAADIERFRVARGGGRGARARTEALMPVISSAICLIEDHRIYYRGRDALLLAETASLEEVAAILWEDAGSAASTPTLPRLQAREMALFSAPDALRPPQAGEGRGGGGSQFGVLERCQIRLAELAAADLAALDLTRAGVVRTGRLILGELAAAVGAAMPSPLPIHHQLGAAWGLDEAGTDLLRRCLVLLADHELNASTFVARCVASTGATPYAAVSAALAALSGRRHGGASTQVEAMFRELGDAADPLPAMAARLARGEALPGLGQPLYPRGDPRAQAIIAALTQAAPDAGARVATAAAGALRLTGEAPNVDFALGAASVALGLPSGAALGIFLVSRSLGCIAHAIEQYESAMLIRPRACYMGIRPKAGTAG